MSEKIKLLSPWELYVRKMKVMFDKDAEIYIEYDEENSILEINVSDLSKALALTFLIPDFVEFGDKKVTNVIKFDGENLKDPYYICSLAFNNNDSVSSIIKPHGQFLDGTAFVCFKKEVVQYPNDNMFDANGVCSTLYQNLAKELFPDKVNIFFCTDTKESKS